MMRHLVIAGFMASALLFFSTHATAQPPRGDSYYDRGEFRSTQTFFHQVRADVDRAERNTYGDYGEDQRRFERVRGELSELQRQWDENEYSPRQVDNVIVALQRVLADNNLSLRDHDGLARDLSELRDFRAQHGY